MALLGGKWKAAIIYHLERTERLRFGELRRLIPDATQRMLTQQQRELERHGFISRKQYAETPPRVEYSLTKLGASLEGVFKTVCHWSLDHLKSLSQRSFGFDSRRLDLGSPFPQPDGPNTRPSLRKRRLVRGTLAHPNRR